MARISDGGSGISSSAAARIAEQQRIEAQRRAEEQRRREEARRAAEQARKAAQQARAAARAAEEQARPAVDKVDQARAELAKAKAQLRMAQMGSAWGGALRKSDSATGAAKDGPKVGELREQVEVAKQAVAKAESAARELRQKAIGAAQASVEAQLGANDLAARAGLAKPFEALARSGIKDAYDAASLKPEDHEKLIGAPSVVSTGKAAEYDAQRIALATEAGPEKGAKALAQLLTANSDPKYQAALIEQARPAIAAMAKTLAPGAKAEVAPNGLRLDMHGLEDAPAEAVVKRLADAARVSGANALAIADAFAEGLPPKALQQEDCPLRAALRNNAASGDFFGQAALSAASAAPASVAGARQQVAGLPLSADEKGRLNSAIGDKALGSDVRTVLANLEGLSPQAQASFLRTLTADTASSVGASALSVRVSDLRQMVTAPGFQMIERADQARLGTVLEATGGSGVGSLKTLMCQPERLLKTDKDGTSLLANLERIATQPLERELEEAQNEQVENPYYASSSARQRLLMDVLREVANPGSEINQSSFGTCTVTSIQYNLVRNDPAEYLRIIAGLTASEGKATLRNGDTLGLQHEYLQNEPEDSRSLSEVVFQGAAMEYANGDLEYDAARDENVKDFKLFKRDRGSGLVSEQVEKMLEALYGEEYRQGGSLTEQQGGFLGIGDKTVADARDLGFFKWYSPDSNDNAVTIGVSMPGGYQHELSFVGEKDGRFYVRNPWGAAGDPESYAKQMGCKLEDPMTGLMSFSEQEFLDRVKHQEIPEELWDSYERAGATQAANRSDASPQDYVAVRYGRFGMLRG